MEGMATAEEAAASCRLPTFARTQRTVLPLHVFPPHSFTSLLDTPLLSWRVVLRKDKVMIPASGKTTERGSEWERGGAKGRQLLLTSSSAHLVIVKCSGA